MLPETGERRRRRGGLGEDAGDEEGEGVGGAGGAVRAERGGGRRGAGDGAPRSPERRPAGDGRGGRRLGGGAAALEETGGGEGDVGRGGPTPASRARAAARRTVLTWHTVSGRGAAAGVRPTAVDTSGGGGEICYGFCTANISEGKVYI